MKQRAMVTVRGGSRCRSPEDARVPLTTTSLPVSGELRPALKWFRLESLQLSPSNAFDRA